MTPLEQHAGVYVKREDLLDPGLPSGKLRGLVPYLRGLQQDGVRTVVNAGATHSNSHAITAYAARQAGLQAVTVVNSARPHPATDQAADLGAEVVYTRPSHLGPLRAAARRVAADRDAVLLPWGLATTPIVRHYAAAVGEVHDVLGYGPLIHVVPMGAGGWTVGVWHGIAGTDDQVVAVPVMPTTQRNDMRRLSDLTLTIGLPGGLSMTDPLPAEATPWPSDPTYEHVAWPVALALHSEGMRVVFWSIGQALR